MRTFDKAAIPVDAQLDLLAKRGLSIQDRERAKKFLEVVSYFRLSAYMRPFQTHGHAFVAGARFQQVTQLYVFDQRLRLLVMEAIERVEVAMRALLGNHMGPTHGRTGICSAICSRTGMATKNCWRAFRNARAMQCVTTSANPSRLTD